MSVSPRRAAHRKLSCVYLIRCSDGRVYVGATSDFAVRRNKHLSDLRLGRHDNKPLQHAWELFGESAFEIFPWVKCSVEDLAVVEQRVLDQWRAAELAFNVGAHAAFSTKGVKPSLETRARLSVALKGRVVCPEHARRISKGRRSQPHRLKNEDGRRVTVTNMRLWCRENGLNRRNILAVISGERASHKGWKCL